MYQLYISSKLLRECCYLIRSIRQYTMTYRPQCAFIGTINSVFGSRIEEMLAHGKKVDIDEKDIETIAKSRTKE